MDTFDIATVDVAIVAAAVVAFAAVSARLTRTIITGPMVFIAFGLIVGPEVLDVVNLSLDNELVRTLVELTLVLVLFVDAARIELRVLQRNSQVPIRLLGIGLPLTVVLGALAGFLVIDGLGIWEAAVLAAVLAPTDAALGQAVIGNARVPGRIRQALNVESGLNDGIVVPVITLCIVAAGTAAGLQSAGFWVEFALKQIGFGLTVGIGAGLVVGWVVDRGTHTGWMSRTFQHLAILAVPILSFALAEAIDGNGFIAAFMAGLVVGNVTRHLSTSILEFSEEEGQLLVLLTFMIFGGAFVGPALDELTWRIALYAVLSLTVVRFVPVAVSLIGMRLQRDTVAFLGWFGPRGLASIVFGLLVLETMDVPHREEIFLVVVWTVLLSVVAHGLTAQPGANWYGTRAELMAEEPKMPEMMEVEELPMRARLPSPRGPHAPSEPE